MTTTLWGVLAGSLLGSSHCVGMCGGFAAALGAGERPMGPILARQLVYNLGRVFTYAFMGALAGTGGVLVTRWSVGPVSASQALSLLAGVIMLGVGVSALGWLPRSGGLMRYTSGLLLPLFNYFLNARGWWGYFAAGLANGFLPCGLVYAFVALAAASGTFASGVAIMLVFGLGTLPAMMLIGCGSAWLTHAVRRRVLRAAAVFAMVFGGVTIWRAFPTGDAPCCHETMSIPLSRADGLP